MEEDERFEDGYFEEHRPPLQDRPHRSLGFALLNMTAIRAEYFGTHRRIRRLQGQLLELEIQIAQAEALVGEALIPSWPPLPDPVRPPTLHQAIRLVLEAKANRWMRTDQIARQIAKRRLYRRRDGLAASTKDVSARVSSYSTLFERQGAVVRLRGVPPPSEEYVAAIQLPPPGPASPP